MLSSYPVVCPHPGCDWKGNVVPSQVAGGGDAEIAPLQRAWFQCGRCRRNWEVRIQVDKVVVLPAAEQKEKARPL